LFDKLAGNAKSLRLSLDSMVIVPMLAVTLEEIKGAEHPDDEYGGRLWYDGLRAALTRQRINLEQLKEKDACAVAQALLGDLFLTKGLDALLHMHDDQVEDADDD
jgi:hypothetical protein